MVNPVSTTTPIEIGGKTYQLRYEHRDFAEAEGRLKMALLGPPAAEFWSTDLPSYQTGILLFVGLLHNPPVVTGADGKPCQFTLDDARALITFDNIDQVGQIVKNAVIAALGEADKGGKKEAAEDGPPLPESNTGGSSGQ